MQLTTNGSINAEEMKKYLNTELFKDEWQKELAGKVIPKCLNEKYGKYSISMGNELVFAFHTHIMLEYLF